MRNLETVAYSYNKRNAGSLTKPIYISNLYRGITVGFQVSTGKGGADICWNNKHIINSGKRTVNGEEVEVKLKSRLNNFTFGYHYMLFKGFRAGISLGVGFFNIYNVRESETKYQKFYGDESKSALNSSVGIYVLKNIVSILLFIRAALLTLVIIQD